MSPNGKDPVRSDTESMMADEMLPGTADFGGEDGLTCIHGRIHCGATADTTGEGNELDQLAINTFLDTLAEVALAVAWRRERID